MFEFACELLVNLSVWQDLWFQYQFFKIGFNFEKKIDDNDAT